MPSLAILMGKPKRSPAGGVPEEEETSSEEQACKDLAEVLGVPAEKYEEFRTALDNWFAAKRGTEPDEAEEGDY